uniref:Uncharacterized protein n=1 Tax=Tanacetum cinerariifolium TaxID=118510 RepID=A0A699W8C6_TANCI|nr:hypothetical protein [Tanacetum cinerariifolium]
MARLRDLSNVIRAVFSSTLKSFAIMTGNLSSPSKNAYSRWGDEVGSSSTARNTSTSSRRKSLFPNGVRVGEVVETIGS